MGTSAQKHLLKVSKGSHAGIVFEPLEPRLLLSGTWGAGADAPAADEQTAADSGFSQDTVVPASEPVDSTDVAVTHPNDPAGTVDLLTQAPTLSLFGSVVPEAKNSFSADPLAAPAETTSENTFGEELAATEESAAEAPRELVLINDNVTDCEQLVADIQGSDGDRTIEVVVLDSTRDGIDQVSDILADRSDLSAVHVITHGSDGQIRIGNTWLNRATLPANSDAIAGWGDAFNATGDFLFYGCNLAKSDAGMGLINDLQNLTSTDVAASDDLTGHTRFGADWELEYTRGSVETSTALSTQAQDAYENTLATYTVSSLADSGVGTLRQAILDANANGGADTIEFTVTGTINLSSALPVISEQVSIDGSSAPGYAGDPVINLDGSGVAANGLHFASGADSSSVHALMITNFTGNGIQVDAGADGITITGNWIGTTGTGTTGDGNTNNGINVQGANTIIGGTGVNDGNVITNNGNEGINVTGSGATGTIIQGNIIGLDPDGATGSGNVDVGIALLSGANNTTIGSSTAAARNIISNNYEGIEINSNNNIVQGNTIGTDISGMLARGNHSDDGIEIQNGATGNLIGGTHDDAGNLIAFNALDGVNIVSGSGNAVLGNDIHSNGDLAIDLGATANNAQAAPVLTLVKTDGSQIEVVGSLSSAANEFYRIEFFATDGGIQSYIGYANVATDGTGNATINVTINSSVAVGVTISATATHSDAGYTTFSDTSELSAGIVATDANNAPLATDDPGAYSAGLLALNPLGYWRLGDTAASAADLGSSVNDGTYNSGTVGQAGAISGDSDTAVRFDGTDDYVAIDHSDDYLLDNGTVQLWFNADTASTGSEQQLFSKDSMGFDTGGHLSIYLTGSGHLEVRLQSTSADYFVTTASAVSPNEWHHAAFSFGADGMTLYLDGVAVDTHTYTGGLGTTSGGVGNYEPIAIGGGTQNSGDLQITPVNELFTGQIDEVAIVGSQLSGAAIRELYGAGRQDYTVDEDSTLAVSATDGVLANDFDPDGDALTVTELNGNAADIGTTISLGSGAQLRLNADGSLSYDPNGQFEYLKAGETATDTFTYAVSDGNGGTDTATVTITIAGANDAPTVSTVNLGSINEDNAITITQADLLIGSSDVDSDSLTAANLALSSGSGSITDNGDGTWTFTPDANWNGAVGFTFDVSDGTVAVANTASLTVTSVNDAPIARPDGVHLTFDGDDFVRIADDPSLQMSNNVTMEAWINHNGGGTGSQLIFNKEGEYELGITADTGEIKYAIAENTDTWSWHNTGYSVTAGEWTHVAVTFDGATGQILTYINGNLVDTYNQAGPMGDVYPTYNNASIGGRENATDQRFQGQIDEVRVWSTTRSQAEIQANMNGLLTGGELNLEGYWRLDEAGSGTIVDLSGNGNDGVLGGAEGASATPTYQGYVTDEDTPLAIAAGSGVLANDSDADGDPLTVAAINGSAADVGSTVTLTSGALVRLNADGSFSYDPNGQFDFLTPGETVTDTFTYVASDGTSDSSTATVTITITGVNDAPTVSAVDLGGINEDGSLLIGQASLLTGSSDVELDSLIAANLALVSGSGTLTDNGDGTWTFTPDADWNGAVSFTFDVSDGTATTANTASLTVTAVNDAPTVSAVNLGSINEDDSLLITQADLLTGSSDVDLDGLTAANLVLASGSGSLTDNGDDTWTFTPTADWNGAASFTFDVSDGTAATANTASLTVAAVNDEPTIGGVDAGAVVEDVDPDADLFLETGGVLTIADPDAGESHFTAATVTGTYGNLVIDAVGNWSYGADTTQTAIQQLDAGESITDVLAVSTADGTVHLVTVTITGAEDAPMISGPTAGAVTKDTNLSTGGTLTITDPDTSDNPIAFNPVAAAPGNNGYGTFALSGGTWSYTLNNAHGAVQALNTGDTLTDTITFTADDGSTCNVTVTINAVENTTGKTPVYPVDSGPDPVDPTPEPEPNPEPEPELEPNEILPPELELPPAEEPAVAVPGPAHVKVVSPTQQIVANFFVPKIVLPVAAAWMPADSGPAAGSDDAIIDYQRRDLALREATGVAHESSAGVSVDPIAMTLNRIQRQFDLTMAADAQESQIAIGVATGLGVSVFAGYVIWAFRGGSLIVGALSALPMWRCFDPLPVLLNDDRKNRRKDARQKNAAADKEDEQVKKLLRADRSASGSHRYQREGA